ncbi:16S rRNA (guanine(527)-N(7))-methyltransferase RsmG [Clostridiisalibacter paucivorans]|uniref:16S rRNA (guanine(527)-N(7))-methyltransferase RsmG n=1 Tax=Clostridiisalibacter paucivorans TaxID=408753 RepID=UPI00047A9DEC|nr:16S rRNA (guanine(527)-N(7))-methyltransferase RsmG [Clostridiisalibacter paucivorans]
MSDNDILRRGLKTFGIDIDDIALQKFGIYKKLLKEWNEKINITAITDDKEIDIKHFLDSLTVLKGSYIEGKNKVLDVGTGGGFPGLPLKIMNDEIDLVLLDSLKKRIRFLDEVVKELELKNVLSIHGRAEDYGHDSDYREQFDVVVSRAVASLNILLEYCIPFVKKGGYFIALKGPNIKDEIQSSKKALNIFGCKIIKEEEIKLPFSDIIHTVLVIKKTSKTSTKYPRKPGTPKKKPL